jgi:hypothetical protein
MPAALLACWFAAGMRVCVNDDVSGAADYAVLLKKMRCRMAESNPPVEPYRCCAVQSVCCARVSYA